MYNATPIGGGTLRVTAVAPISLHDALPISVAQRRILSRCKDERSGASMKRLIAGVVLGVGLTAMAHGAGDPAAGEQNAAVCASCHGQGGAKPIMAAYPKLSGIGERYTYLQLVDIKNGDRPVPEMTGMLDAMSDQDLQNLAAYFNQHDMVVAQADPELVEQGQALYRGGNMA